jgi:hypothetical protein
MIGWCRLRPTPIDAPAQLGLSRADFREEEHGIGLGVELSEPRLAFLADLGMGKDAIHWRHRRVIALDRRSASSPSV